MFKMFKRLLPILMAAALLAGGCSSPKPSSGGASPTGPNKGSSAEGSPSNGASSPIKENSQNLPAPAATALTPEQKAQLELAAVDFALNFPQAFSTTAELNSFGVAWYTFWALYNEGAREPDAQGYLHLPKAEVDGYAQKHFGLSQVSYPEDIPAFDEATQTYAFYPVGEAPWLEIDVGESVYAQDGLSVEYSMTIYDKAMGEEMPERKLRGEFIYKFLIGGSGGYVYLQMDSCKAAAP